MTPDPSVATGGVELGYFLSSEEHAPSRLVDHAQMAWDAGLTSAMISDHVQPWTEGQGESPFVWTVIGAIARATPGLELGTGVSAVGRRVSPLVLAHAAATAALLLDGRFFLGVGTGERLNEQVMGDRWPRAGERRKALEEALPLLRRLLSGETVNHRGDHFALEHARIHSCPAAPPPILVAASGRRSARTAGELGDGLIGVAPTADVVEAFEAAGGAGKPRYAQLKLCWAADERAAIDTVRQWFPTAALPPSMLSELPTPAAFGDAVELLSDDRLAAAVTCGPEVEHHRRAVERLVGAGFTRIFLHQVGPDQAGFLEFYRTELEPALRRTDRP